MLGEWARFEPEEYLRSNHPGVRVVDRRLRPGLQGCIDHQKRIIYLDSGLSPVVRRCTLTYEIAHLECGPTPQDPCLAAAHKRAAVEWAALMLIPSDEFIDAWANCLDYATMAARVGVDLPTFRARIRAASDSDQDLAIAAIAATRLSA